MSLTSKERIRMLLGGEIPDRIGKADAPWPETRERWYKEGLPAGVHANDYFQMDVRMMIQVSHSFQLPESIVEETDEYVVSRDGDGNLVKGWKGRSGAPLVIEPAVNSRDDWERVKERLVANDRRFAFGYYGNYYFEYAHGEFSGVKAAYDACTNCADTFVVASVADPYEFALSKMGDENLLTAMALDPGLLHDMFKVYVKMAVESCDIIFRSGMKPDGFFIGGDIAYKNGLLFSPKLHREIIFPYLKEIIDYLKRERGQQVIYHSDGKVTEAIPLLVEAGIDCLQPLEVNAGMDVRTLAREWGKKLAFMGNISNETMSGPKDDLEEEVRSKIDACRRARARYIIHSDHSVPPTVPYENFRFMMELVDRYGKY